MEGKDYQALLLLSFGGPEGMDDVMPFLRNVLRGRDVPEERMREVAHHYELFGGVSPINGQNRQLIKALETEFSINNIGMPIYWGNRNWHPMLSDTLRKMRADGVKRALVFATSAYSSYSGCRQYLEDIERASAEVGEGAPHLDKLRVFFNHPLFIEANVHRVSDALNAVPAARRQSAAVAFTAHSIPKAMATNCQYESQLRETCRLVADSLGIAGWSLVFQSRSGPPQQPWLEPDICDHLRELARANVRDVVVSPVGFISDHMEVVYDLDTEAQQVSSDLGINMVRAKTAGIHPAFVSMLRELVEERLHGAPARAIGTMPPAENDCLPGCCERGYPTARPPASAST